MTNRRNVLLGALALGAALVAAPAIAQSMPEIKWRLTVQEIERFPPLQKAILANSLQLLKPGGRLVYATCSLEREENEDVVAGLPVRSTLHRLPGRDPGDGFFAAVIEP